MIRLFRVEVRRLLARRLFRVAMVVVFLFLLTILGVIAYQSHRDVAAAQAKAHQEAAREFAAQAAPPPQVIDACRARLPPGVPPEACSPPTTSEADLYANLYQDPRFIFSENADNFARGIVALMCLLGLLVGASFVGAEWGAGTMASLLTWEPRRWRVLVAKLMAAVVVLAIAGAVFVALGVGGAWLVAAIRGSTAQTTHHLLVSVAKTGGRGLLLVALLTAGGCAASGFSRHTPVALAVAIGYLVAVEGILRGLRPAWERWFLVPNGAAVLSGKIVLVVPQRVGGQPSPGTTFLSPQTIFVLHAGRAALYLTAMAAVVVLFWAVTFLRGDVDEGGAR
ncbi:MAG: hypothetical protein NVSMB32_10110 [Actinomycetota bacterium]